MARVNVEQKALTDGRFRTLGRAFGVRMTLAQAAGIGLMILVWNQCQERERETLTTEEIDGVLGIRGAWQKLLDADLGERTPIGEIRIRGTSGRIEWLASRRHEGRLAKGGGRPRKTPMGSAPETPGGLPQKTPPTPAPAPTRETPSKNAREAAREEKPRGDGKPTLAHVLYLADQIGKWSEANRDRFVGNGDAWDKAFVNRFGMSHARYQEMRKDVGLEESK